jgi:hypothetical protein
MTVDPKRIKKERKKLTFSRLPLQTAEGMGNLSA